MRISEGERRAIIDVLAAGAAYGYGNMIGHLNTAWVRKMIQDGYAENEQEAANMVHGTPYPLAMQDDLIQRGEWDETGKRYVTSRPPARPPTT